MLEHAKTHHTNYIKGKAYEVVVPPEKEKMFTMFVEKHGFTIKRGDEQSIPWRESFSEISDEKLPGKIRVEQLLRVMKFLQQSRRDVGDARVVRPRPQGEVG